MKKSTKDSFIIGFALFAMFFGSGNLIFPPSLGRAVGAKFPIAILGFVLTGVGLPLLGILACAKINGTFKEMSCKINMRFSKIVTTALILAIGPLLAIPRTAATTFELSIQPIFPNANITISIIVYFAVTLCFVLRPSSIIDSIGKFLTPILFILLFIIILKGIINPIGVIKNTLSNSVLSNSLLEGYQTMDAIASVIFASIVISAVKSKGYTKESDIIKITSISGVIAVIGLALIYGGLMYLGSQTSLLFSYSITKTQLVTEIVKLSLGKTGVVLLGLSVALACLTTSIGLTSSAAEYFSKFFRNKISYNTASIIIAVTSILIASMGVDSIIIISVPILKILYPIVIVLVLTTLLEKIIIGNLIIKLTVYITLIVNILDNLHVVGIHITWLQNILSKVPFHSIGFVWVVPSLSVFMISTLYVLITKKNDTYSNLDL